MAHDVFISYSHKDKAVADAICARLEQGGARCWYAPRDIVPGADWAASIIEAIKTTKVMVLVFTDYSNASQQVKREVSNAVSNGVTIVPFKLTEALPTEGMQYYLSTVHWLDAMDRPLTQSVEQLNGLIQAVLSGATPDASMFAAPPVEKRSLPSWAYALISFAAVLLVGGVILLPKYLSSRQAAADAQASAAQEAVEGSDEGSDEGEASGDTALETIAIPTNGSAEIANPDNTGTQGNLQGNYQNGGIAASDGEWFYYCSGGAMYKMRLDGSEKTQLTDVDCRSIGVIDGYIYYATVGSSGICENINRMTVDGTQNTTIYNGMFEDMAIVDGRIYFKNSLDHLKLYSIALDGTDSRCEGDISSLFYITFWGGKMYWANDDDGRCLYCANYDGSEATKLTTSAVDSITAADGWILYHDLGDNFMHYLNAETLEDHKVMFLGIYDPVISSYGLVGQSSVDGLQLFRSELGTSGGSVLTDFQVDDNCVCEGYIFFVGEEDGNTYMVDIYGENLTQL